MKLDKEACGEHDGKPVCHYTLSNDNTMEVKITNYGGIITSIKTPDKDGNLEDIVLGFNTPDDYIRDNSPYFGCITGRYANRIARGSFTLKGKDYKLAQNNGGNHLHGGETGFNSKTWDAEELKTNNAVGLKLKYVSPDGEESYPGTLTTTVTYTLNNSNELRIDYHAVTDAPTVLNLTNHSYFNLAGEGSGTAMDHVMMIDAGAITQTDKDSIPTGILLDITGTPMDFRTPARIGDRIEEAFSQLKYGVGYDHNYIPNGKPGKLRTIARVEDPASGRVMEVDSTQPGVQFYTANWLDGTLTGKSGKPYGRRDAFCLETQHYPDSPNHPDFPSTMLNPGEIFEESTVYRFTELVDVPF